MLGPDFDVCADAFREYMDRNEDNRTRVLVRALKLTYAMEQSQQDLPKITELTDLLVKSEYITNPEIENELPEANVASLLTMRQLGLSWRHEWDEAGRVCLQIMDRFYPQRLSGASAAMNFGLYLWMRQGDYDGALTLRELTYSPSNGISSTGDIIRTGP